MSLDTEQPSNDPQSGMIADGILQEHEPAWGERAEHIRLLHDRFPRMPKSVIAEKVGCDPSNVTRVINRYVKTCSLEELQDFQSNKADIFDAMQHKMLASITDAAVGKCSALQLITGAAILEDKSRLVRGQPTSIHVHALVDVLDALAARQDRDDD